jgi:hypothetical protein
VKDKKPIKFLEEVTDKIETIDCNLLKVKHHLGLIAEAFTEPPERCPDLVESEIELQKALDAYFVDELINAKPVGEA